MAAKPAVLILTHLFPLPGGVSFSGTFIVEQLVALQRYYEVVVMVPQMIWPRELLRRKKVTAHETGLAVYYLRYFPALVIVSHLWRSLLLRLRFVPKFRREELLSHALQHDLKRYLEKQIIRHVRALHRRYHFLLVHGHELFIGDEAGRIGAILGIPSVVTIHALYDFHEARLGRQAMRLVLENLNRANALVTVSKIARDSYKGKVTKSMQIIPNGYTPPKKIPPAPPHVQQFVAGRKVLLYGGYLMPTKRVDLLLKAVKELGHQLGNACCLLIVGIGPTKEQLQNWAQRHDLFKQVLFAGEVPPSQLSGYYQLADVIVQPSVSDSFSMVCLEGMAFGKPFICTNRAGIAEYVRNGREAFIVEPDNLDQLVDRLRLLLTDDQRRLTMGQRAKETARAFTWEKKILHTVRLYRRLLAASQPRPRP
jgi:glycosyltransferase involved in cell wall biosynthesis